MYLTTMTEIQSAFPYLGQCDTTGHGELCEACGHTVPDHSMTEYQFSVGHVSATEDTRQCVTVSTCAACADCLCDEGSGDFVTYEQRQAAVDHFSAFLRYFPSAHATREDLRAWWQWNDPNGCWNPSDPEHADLSACDMWRLLVDRNGAVQD